jgi:signal transduction histidine kinase
VLEKLDKTKSDFIEIAAHELRTPLTLVKGYAQLLEPIVSSTPEAHSLLEGILAGQTRLHEIVTSLLDISKITSEVLRVVKRPVDVAAIIKNVQAAFEPTLQERHLKLETIGLDTLPVVRADPDLLYKLFYHLLVNAIKYTPDGGAIAISGQVVAESTGRPVEIIVSDTGIGIDPDEQELVFEKFYQTGQVTFHSTGKTKFKGGGPGLGLAIAKGIVLAHGGKIWVESAGYDEERCPGSRFHVCLPVE